MRTYGHSKSGQQYITPDDLYEISLIHPPLDEMRQLIRDAYQNQCLSPTFIDTVIMNLPYYDSAGAAYVPHTEVHNQQPEIFQPRGDQSVPTHVTLPNSCAPSASTGKDESKEPMSPDVYSSELSDFSVMDFGDPICIEHIVGQTDLMSGALSPGVQKLNIPLNDKLDCAPNLNDQLRHMKWRILTSRELVCIKGLFQYPAQSYKVLGENFMTTNEGLRRAIEEVRNMDGFPQPEVDEAAQDAVVLEALLKRGAVVAGTRTVIYPEDLLGWADYASDNLDLAYWSDLYDQGKLVNDMPTVKWSLDAKSIVRKQYE